MQWLQHHTSPRRRRSGRFNQSHVLPRQQAAFRRFSENMGTPPAAVIQRSRLGARNQAAKDGRNLKNLPDASNRDKNSNETGIPLAEWEQGPEDLHQHSQPAHILFQPVLSHVSPLYEAVAGPCRWGHLNTTHFCHSNQSTIIIINGPLLLTKLSPTRSHFHSHWP
jgi:hypothetical protein